LHPIVGADLGDCWYLRGAAVFFGARAWATTSTTIRQSGAGVRWQPGALRRHLGEVVLGWEVARGLTVEAAYSAFEAGPFIEQTGPAKTAHFVGTEVQLRF
jgi:hypothetical protein